MAPIKFEENIKNKLEKRTLSPSSESWSKLSDRLDAEEHKSKSPFLWWLSIAAGIIVMIAVSAHFLKSSSTENKMPKMVNDDSKVEQIKEKVPNLNESKNLELVSEDELINIKNKNSMLVEVPQIISSKKDIGRKQDKTIQLAKNEVETYDNRKLNKPKELNANIKELTNESIMKEALADAMNDLNSENSSITDREIDSLLKVASKELFKEKLQDETLITVDANVLLMSVEDEMGQSFRSKVFEALKGSYETVKTAVAQRNN